MQRTSRPEFLKNCARIAAIRLLPTPPFPCIVRWIVPPPFSAIVWIVFAIRFLSNSDQLLRIGFSVVGESSAAFFPLHNVGERLNKIHVSLRHYRFSLRFCFG